MTDQELNTALANLETAVEPPKPPASASPAQQRLNQRVNQCLILPEHDQAMACFQAAIKEASAEGELCKPRMVLITQQGCGFCEEARETYKEELASGAIQEVDIATSDGKDLVEKNEVDGTPMLLVVDCHNEEIIPDAEPDAASAS